MARWVLDRLEEPRDTKAESKVAALIPRERQVLRLIGDGLTNTSMASRLSLAPSTVQTHVDSLLPRMGVRTRVEAALLAHEAGLLSTER